MDPVSGPQRAGIARVLDRMDALAAQLPPGLEAQRHWLGTYRRTTAAVGQAVAEGRFEDPDWVDRWDVVFADFYFDAVAGFAAGGPVSLPWRLAFTAPPELPVLRHVLVGLNAHLNFDLPQALLAVVDDADFSDPVVLSRRHIDHERIDAVLASRVATEDLVLNAGRRVRLLDRVLRPLNRYSTVRFVRESRRKVWHNVMQLHRARMLGSAPLAERVAELEQLSAARVADLLAPGQVFFRLAVNGFGVTLPPR